MTYAYTQTQRVGDQYAASHRPGHGRVFEPITLAEARDIVARIDVRAARDGIEGWLAALPEKVTDEVVYADAENGAVLCALTITWADDLVRANDLANRITFAFIDEIVVGKLRPRRGIGAGAIRGLLNCWRADVQRTAKRIAEEIADVKPFTDDDLDITPPAPEFAKIVEFLRTLAQNGLKKPIVRIVTNPNCGVSDERAEFASDHEFEHRHDACNHIPVVLKNAGPGSKVQGGVGISDGGPYGASKWYGWVLADGNANGPLKQHADIIDTLRNFAANPEVALVKYGRVLGSCGICGRTLSDPKSIARGIGPICAEKGGL